MVTKTRSLFKGNVIPMEEFAATSSPKKQPQQENNHGIKRDLRLTALPTLPGGTIYPTKSRRHMLSLSATEDDNQQQQQQDQQQQQPNDDHTTLVERLQAAVRDLVPHLQDTTMAENALDHVHDVVDKLQHYYLLEQQKQQQQQDKQPTTKPLLPQYTLFVDQPTPAVDYRFMPGRGGPGQNASQGPGPS